MTLALDHVFVCVAAGAEAEASALASAGLVEGAPNVHPGQGTACRRFFFQNAYLELLWVRDEREASEGAGARLRLLERWRGRSDRRASPIGVAVRASGEPVPFRTWDYRPDYLPPDVGIPVAEDDGSMREPLIFVAPHRDSVAQIDAAHPLGVRTVTRVEIEDAPATPGPALAALARAGVVELRAGARPHLVLGFDGERRGREVDLRPLLPLALRL